MPEASIPKSTAGVRATRRVWLWALIAVWLVAVAGGLSVVWAYDNTPGVSGNSPHEWPTGVRFARAADRPTLVLLAHPQCSCTQATLAELGEILARTKTRPKTYVLFLKPFGVARNWEQTDLWQTAARLPDVTVLRDDDGLEATRFGAVTSGQTVLYDAEGALLFSGGITGSRGHAGENAGMASLLAALDRGTAERPETSVFGCSLFAFAS